MRAAWTGEWGPSPRCRSAGVSPLDAPSEHDCHWQPVVQKACNKTDEHTATLHPSDILGSIHVEWVKVEPTSLVGAWGTQKQEIWRIFAKLLGYFKICLQIVWLANGTYSLSQWSEARWTKNFSHQKSLAMHHAMRFTHGPTYLGLQPSQVMDRQLLGHTLFLLRREMETWLYVHHLFGDGMLAEGVAPWGLMASSANTVPVSTSVTTLRFTELHNGPCFPGTGICAIYESCFTHVCRGPGDVSDEPDWLRASSGCSAHQNSMGPCSFSGTWSMSGASFTSGTRSVHGFRHVHILYNCIKLYLCRVIGTDQVHRKLTSTIRD